MLKREDFDLAKRIVDRMHFESYRCYSDIEGVNGSTGADTTWERIFLALIEMADAVRDTEGDKSDPEPERRE